MSDKSQEEESGEAIAIPFEKRFNIPLVLDDVKKRFMNRIFNSMNQNLSSLSEFGPSNYYSNVLRYVANGLGVEYNKYYGFKLYAEKDFSEFLHSIELLYAGLLENDLASEASTLESLIQSAISMSEIDLGIEWRNCIFQRTGAKLLDEELVNEPMKWLNEPKYKNVLQPFQKGLKHYLEAIKDRSKLPDTVTDMYEALEALARIVNGNDKNLSANATQFVDNLGLSEYYTKMLNEYCHYAHQYRHAVRQAKGRIPPKPQEVEAFIYTTGLFIRLATRPS
jgi:hypothetical protein